MRVYLLLQRRHHKLRYNSIRLKVKILFISIFMPLLDDIAISNRYIILFQESMKLKCLQLVVQCVFNTQKICKSVPTVKNVS